MLKSIQSFFSQYLELDSAVDTYSPEQVQLATAALLVEVMLQDEQMLISEQEKVLCLLKDFFALSDERSRELYSLAESEVNNATDYYQFTKLIAVHFSQPEKIQVIELLWRVAFADNHLDAYEEHMIRRIADLIYVSHEDFIKMKLKVQN